MAHPRPSDALLLREFRYRIWQAEADVTIVSICWPTAELTNGTLLVHALIMPDLAASSHCHEAVLAGDVEAGVSPDRRCGLSPSAEVR